MDDNEMETPDRLVRFIDIDPCKPSILHSLESSGSNSPREVNMIERVVEDVREEGEVCSGEKTACSRGVAPT